MKLKRWPRFNDIFAFQPPHDRHHRLSFEIINDAELEAEEMNYEDISIFRESEQLAHHKETWHKIRFDNTIRLLIAVPTYLACFALRMAGVIESILPMTGVFMGFSTVQFLVSWFFMNNRFARKFDFIVCGIDLLAMSMAVYWTGGASSPLYFIYFIPLIVHAFHRDGALVVFNGIGGGFLYGLVILTSLEKYTSTELTDLGARVFFMLLTLGIVCFAVNLLRKKDAVDRLRLNRLRMLTLVGRRLNRISSLNELNPTMISLIKIVNEGLGPHFHSWTRFILVGDDTSTMKAVSDPENSRPDLKQELPTQACPAMKENKPFVLENNEKGPDCPIENFSFGSHVCIPVIGTENEAFGVLFSGSKDQNAYNHDERQFLQYVARSLALSIQRLQRMEELRKAVEMNSCVMAAYIGSSRSTNETYQAIMEGTATILKADQVVLMLWDAPASLLRTVDIRGPHTLQELDFVCQMGEGLAGRILEKGEPFWTTDVPDDPSLKSKGRSIKALLCLPLFTLKKEPLGVITAVRMEQREGFSMTEIDTACTFATRAALAIENAHLHHRERAVSILKENQSDSQKAA